MDFNALNLLTLTPAYNKILLETDRVCVSHEHQSWVERRLQVMFWGRFVSSFFQTIGVVLSVSDPNSPSSGIIELCTKLVTSVIGIITIISTLLLIIIGLISFIRMSFKVCRFIDEINPHMNSFRLAAYRANSFMAKILPNILEKFSAKDLVDNSAKWVWAGVVGSDLYFRKSPKYLNENGKQLLSDSGIMKAVDISLDEFIQNLEEQELSTLGEIEEASFMLLKVKKDEEVGKRLKQYLYDHVEATLDEILIVGSIYLRDKYVEKHHDLLDATSS